MRATRLELSLEPAMPCKIVHRHGATRSTQDNSRKSRYAGIVEAHEWTKTRIETTQRRDHDDLSAAKEVNSLSHSNIVHKPIPILQAMKIPDVKAQVDREWEKLEKLPAWQVTKVKSKKEAVGKAQTEGRTVHFATVMDLCHPKNSELEPKFPEVML